MQWLWSGEPPDGVDVIVGPDLGETGNRGIGRVEKGERDNESKTHGSFWDRRLQEKRAEVS